MSLVTVILSLSLLVAGGIAGYWLRVNQEDTANLKIVTDDERFSKGSDAELHEDLNGVAQNAEILNSYENDYLTNCQKCLNTPYHDDMYLIMQSNGDTESGDTD